MPGTGSFRKHCCGLPGLPATPCRCAEDTRFAPNRCPLPPIRSEPLLPGSPDNWSTPKEVYESLNREFCFTDDPCPIGGSGGLDRAWGSSTFVNPPYSEMRLWVRYGYEQSQLGKTIVMLIPSRTDTKWWHEYAMKADEIRFLRGRLKFGGSRNSAPFPSVLLIYETRNR